MRQSLPSAIPTLALMPLWALGMGASAALSLALDNGAITVHFYELILLYAFGAALACPFALVLARFFGLGRRIDTRFSASFLSLALCTVGMTAFLFSQQYRLFYAQWHGPFGSGLWLNEFVFTSASAVYQFLVSGLRLYLPLGLIELLLASAWMAKRMR